MSDLPSWIGFYAGGKTDVCHPRWDSDFDGAKADRDGLTEALASTTVVVPALLLWLDDFMTAHRVHSCWKHTLDGGCLWHQFEQGGDNYLFNAMWALTLTVVCWLRHVCKGKKVPQVRLICLCNAGKHRSVFSSRMLYFVLQLLYDLLGIQQRRFTWQWAAERRVQAELSEAAQCRDNKAAKVCFRQADLVVSRTRRMFLGGRVPAHLRSVQLLDKDLRETSTTVSAGYSDICLDTRKFIQAAAAERGTPLRKAWLADWLEGAGLAALTAQGRAVLQQASRVRMARHWCPIMRALQQAFPERCGLCACPFQLSTWDTLAAEIHEHFISTGDGASFLTTSPEAASVAAFLNASPRAASGSGAAFLPAAAGEGASFLTASPKAATTRRPAWADVQDDSAHAAAAPSAKKKKRVSFAPEVAQSAAADVEDTALCLVLPCDAPLGVLFQPGAQTLSRRGVDCLLDVTSDATLLSFRVIQSAEDAQGLIAYASELLASSRELQQELAALQRMLVAAEVFPELPLGGMPAMALFQCLVFLYMWSVLTLNYSFLLSSTFLRLVALPLQEAKNFDILAVVHKYCYVTWLRTARPSCWQGNALRLLLPDTADWEAWWAAQQDVAHEIFSEEYALMCRDPLIPEGYRADLKQVRRHVAASDLGLLPELPPRQSFMEHDVYLEASGALPLPRALPAIRCSAGAMEVNWGDNTGEPLNTSRDNVISETDVCLQVPLPVPADMTLGHVLLSRDWRASFEQSNLGMPWWMSDAGGFSAPAAGHAGGFSAPVSALGAQIHLQALGAEIMATLRPDSVMHPHLRAHVELMLGMCASVHLARQEAWDVALYDFLLGCGIRAQRTRPGDADAGWVAHNYRKRHHAARSVVRPVCCTMWGEKYRPIGYLNDAGDIEHYLVHDTRPLGRCRRHKQLMGFGTVCPHWHGFNKKHGIMATLNAQRYLRYTEIGSKGADPRARDQRASQYLRTLLQELGFVARADARAADGDDRVMLIGLPRWLPEFHSNEGQDIPGLVAFTPLHAKKHFEQNDIDECLQLRTAAQEVHDDLERLTRQR